MAANTAELRSAEQWKKLCTDYELLVVHFYAAWSQPCRQMNEALEELAMEHQRVRQVAFVKVEAENFPEISIEHKVVAVPTFIFIKGGKAVDRVDGAHVPEVAKKTTKLIEVTSLTLSPPSAPTESLEERLKKLTTATECVLFMKGAPQEPRCGFSRQVIEILNEIGAEYSTFDILVDQEVRQGLKKFSNWPTYPQLYVKGELIGGIDIIKELRETGELSTLLPMAAKKESLEERLKSLINKAPIVVFMKGSPEEPRCGFSRSTCQILKDTNLQFSTFDILQDEEVRQGLKSYSSWPTYPQVYVKGELVGGLDILKELQESGELLSTLQGNT